MGGSDQGDHDQLPRTRTGNVGKALIEEVNKVR